jgi:hypothetical protein
VRVARDKSCNKCSHRLDLSSTHHYAPPIDIFHATRSFSLSMVSRSPSPEFFPLAIGQDLTPLPDYKEAATTSVNFSNLLEPPLRLHEDLKSGCGGQLWPAGMVLAQHMLRYHKTLLKDARVFVLISLLPMLTFLTARRIVLNSVPAVVWSA